MQIPPDPHTTLPAPMQKFGERFLTFHWPRWFLRFPPVRGWNNLAMFDRWAVLVLVAALLFTGSFAYIAVRQANLAQQGNDFAQYGGPWTAATPGRAVLGQLQPAAVTIINESTQSEVFWIEARSAGYAGGGERAIFTQPASKSSRQHLILSHHPGGTGSGKPSTLSRQRSLCSLPKPGSLAGCAPTTMRPTSKSPNSEIDGSFLKRLRHRMASLSLWQLAWGYLALLTLAELVTTLAEARLGMILHGILLLLLLINVSVSTDGERAAFLVCLTLAPLIRLTSLSMPLPTFPFIYWYAIVGFPLLLAAFFAQRMARLTPAMVGLSTRRPFLQVLIALCGIGLGAMEYLILRPEPLVQEFTWQSVLVPALILLIFTGFLEEFIFRGVMQYTSLTNFGWLGMVYVSLVFAVLHVGYGSWVDVVFVFGVAILFALIAQLTHSIIGVTVAHGLTNIGLFLIFPFLLGAPTIRESTALPSFFGSGASGVIVRVTPLSAPLLPTMAAAQGAAVPTDLAAVLATRTAQPGAEASATMIAGLPPASATPVPTSVTPAAVLQPSRQPTTQVLARPTATSPPSPTSVTETPSVGGGQSPVPPIQTPTPLIKAQATASAATGVAVTPPSTLVALPPAAPGLLAMCPTLEVTATPAPGTPGDMVLIPGGSFSMGCDQSRQLNTCVSDQLPLHTLYISPFKIDRFEVTNAQYAECVNKGACQPPAFASSATRPDYYFNPTFANYPVVNVSWQDAQTYCTWAGKRLPTEAEWERSARGDGSWGLYPWGNQTPDCSLANYYSNLGYCAQDTLAVGSMTAGMNSFGIFDLSGNVTEWVADWYSPYYYRKSPENNPPGPDPSILNPRRVARGGSWEDKAYRIRLSMRLMYPESTTSTTIGFRCAASP